MILPRFLLSVYPPSAAVPYVCVSVIALLGICAKPSRSIGYEASLAFARIAVARPLLWLQTILRVRGPHRAPLPGPPAAVHSPRLFPRRHSLLAPRVSHWLCFRRCAAGSAFQIALKPWLGSCALRQFHVIQCLFCTGGLLPCCHVSDCVTITFVSTGPHYFQKARDSECGQPGAFFLIF